MSPVSLSLPNLPHGQVIPGLALDRPGPRLAWGWPGTHSLLAVSAPKLPALHIQRSPASPIGVEGSPEIPSLHFSLPTASTIEIESRAGPLMKRGEGQMGNVGYHELGHLPGISLLRRQRSSNGPPGH